MNTRPIYFKRVEFVEYRFSDLRSILLVDLVKREVSYQTYGEKRNPPSMVAYKKMEFMGEVEETSVPVAAMKISDGKNGFTPTVLETDTWESVITSSVGIKITDEQLQKLLPYCNALDFEPYRERKMEFDDPGRIGYRDELRMAFKGISDSYLPYIELPMDYYYDEAHIWPSEKLYRYIVITLLKEEKKKKKRNRWPMYGTSSLFI